MCRSPRSVGFGTERVSARGHYPKHRSAAPKGGKPPRHRSARLAVVSFLYRLRRPHAFWGGRTDGPNRRRSRCGRCGGVIKPEITFFGESLPAKALAEAQEEASAADLLMVLGSSLTVYPAAALPDLTLRNGGKVVAVNEQPTRIDAAAVLKLDDLGAVFDALEAKLGAEK